jgi:hypothetical protein
VRAALLSLLLMPLAAAPLAHADALPSPGDFDGLYLMGGPLGATTHVGKSWYGGGGLELSVVDVRTHRIPTAFGLALGGVGYAGLEGGRLWAELEVAERGPLPLPVGLGVGPTFDVSVNGSSHPGVEGTFWIYAGVIPYVRVGDVPGGEAKFVELGFLFKLPLHRFRLR